MKKYDTTFKPWVIWFYDHGKMRYVFNVIFIIWWFISFPIYWLFYIKDAYKDWRNELKSCNYEQMKLLRQIKK